MNTLSTPRQFGTDPGTHGCEDDEQGTPTYHVRALRAATLDFEVYPLKFVPPFVNPTAMLIPADPHFVTRKECWFLGALTVFFALACILN
ncbi:hypothetical protein [Variovorax saccharolyticus]|uniref:hypothetical protein n=1 Tax=Variovorax saccharolyticus TaxID=3053516 RepID=UPI0025759CEF|nr:hypothetical protein [Variovorax sp. J31P216]MDM0029164.1 hypothetical protein [Variovorax sp. J31P216]